MGVDKRVLIGHRARGQALAAAVIRAASELEIHADSCTGPLLARLPWAINAMASACSREWHFSK